MTAEARQAASLVIADTASHWLAARLVPGACVALYAAKGSELDTVRLDELARAAGFAVVYPRVVDHTRQLAFHAVQIADLAAGRFGLREPRTTAPSVVLDDIAAFVVPGVAFDRAGGRLGWGHGYYDATLVASPRALRVGLAFECQVVDEVARDPHDVLLHAVITEVATHTVA